MAHARGVGKDRWRELVPDSRIRWTDARTSFKRECGRFDIERTYFQKKPFFYLIIVTSMLQILFCHESFLTLFIIP